MRIWGGLLQLRAWDGGLVFEPLLSSGLLRDKSILLGCKNLASKLQGAKDQGSCIPP